jgi:methylated-DNA-[protein]-cysteine S-methyltransferase
VKAQALAYEADGWGRGELWLAGDVLVHHELPRPSDGDVRCAPSHPLAERFAAYFAGARDDFRDVALDLDGVSAFTRAVLDALRRVPYGETVTYGELAVLAGYPNAHRAAGSVCAANRFPLVVPCHRVVAATGIGPYGSSGTAYKRRLLELEGARATKRGSGPDWHEVGTLDTSARAVAEGQTLRGGVRRVSRNSYEKRA